MRGLKTSFVIDDDGKSAILKIWSNKKTMDASRIMDALGICLSNISEMKGLVPVGDVKIPLNKIPNGCVEVQLALDTQRNP